MKTFTIALLAGVGALAAATGAKAADVYTTGEYMNPDLIQEVRMVCDEDGNCYRSRSRSRVIVRDSYATMPSDRYYERRTYHRHYDDGPRAGVGIRAPGVSVGVGVNDRW